MEMARAKERNIISTRDLQVKDLYLAVHPWWLVEMAMRKVSEFLHFLEFFWLYLIPFGLGASYYFVIHQKNLVALTFKQICDPKQQRSPLF